MGTSTLNGEAAKHATLWNGTNSNGRAINEAGQIVGVSLLADEETTHAFLWNNGSLTNLTALGGTGTTSLAVDINITGQIQAFGINNHGQISGMNWITLSTHTVRWDGTTLTDLEPLSGTAWSQGWGINDAGQIVGNADLPDGADYHAFLWDNNTRIDLGTLGGTNSDAHAINEAGQIVGWSHLADDETHHAVLWNAATLTDLAALGEVGTFSSAEDINNTGQIAGYSEIAVGSPHATLWENAGLIDLNNFLPSDLAAAGWVLAQAKGINDHGVIVGWATNGLDPNTALTAAFKLTPSAVPVPGAVWLFGSALAGYAGMSRRKQVTV